MNVATERRRFLVRGLVQGVSFRYYAAHQARLLGVAGWVRNLADGRVEAVAEGTRTELDAFAAWLAHGPPSARVEGVEVFDEAPQGERGFHTKA